MLTLRFITIKSVLELLAAIVSIPLFTTALYAADAEVTLMNRAQAVFGTLPAAMESPDNPITPEKVKLGAALFWEPRVSVDRTVSCVKCHPLGLYAADGLRKARGNNCKENPRNAPTI